MPDGELGGRLPQGRSGGRGSRFLSGRTAKVTVAGISRRLQANGDGSRVFSAAARREPGILGGCRPTVTGAAFFSPPYDGNREFSAAVGSGRREPRFSRCCTSGAENSRLPQARGDGSRVFSAAAGPVRRQPLFLGYRRPGGNGSRKFSAPIRRQPQFPGRCRPGAPPAASFGPPRPHPTAKGGRQHQPPAPSHVRLPSPRRYLSFSTARMTALYTSLIGMIRIARPMAMR